MARFSSVCCNKIAFNSIKIDVTIFIVLMVG
jgi:hypothetical protein